MSQFITTDYNCGKSLTNLGGSPARMSESDIKNISHFADKSLAELNKETNLLIFPNALQDSADLLKDNAICRLKRDSDFPEHTTIETYNIAGFIGCNETSLAITSRFTQQKEDYFLHYMLQKVLNLNVANLDFSSAKESVLQLLVYLFPKFLQNALKQGLYKEYQTINHNDEHIRGFIDIPRHIKNNIPFNGKVAYKTREFRYDNTVTELIRHTIEFISSKKKLKGVLSSNQEINEAVALIKAATPNYQQRERSRIVAKALKTKRHPYFTSYTPLIKLCIQILNQREIKMGAGKNKVYGILFDVSWLWEQYLWTVLKEQGFKHPDNRTGKGGIYLFKKHEKEDGGTLYDRHSRCRRYPDFYKPCKNEKNSDGGNPKAQIILDAKYKHLDSSVPREDLFQIISYMHVMECKCGGFVYPKVDGATGIEPLGELCGCGGEVALYGVAIPQQVNGMKEFQKDMALQELELNKSIGNL